MGGPRGERTATTDGLQLGLSRVAALGDERGAATSCRRLGTRPPRQIDELAVSEPVEGCTGRVRTCSGMSRDCREEVEHTRWRCRPASYRRGRRATTDAACRRHASLRGRVIGNDAPDAAGEAAQREPIRDPRRSSSRLSGEGECSARAAFRPVPRAAPGGAGRARSRSRLVVVRALRGARRRRCAARPAAAAAPRAVRRLRGTASVSPARVALAVRAASSQSSLPRRRRSARGDG